MRPRTAVGTAGVVLLLIVAGVQLADPQFGERQPPPVDYSEPPADVAADAATRFEYVDYAYRIEVSKNWSGEWRQYIAAEVDHSDRRYRSVGPRGDRGSVIYSTNAISYVRPGPDGDWHITASAGAEYPAPLITSPISASSLQKGNASIVSENASTIIVEIDVNPVKLESYVPGNTILVINKTSGLIETALVSSKNTSESYYIRFQLIETHISVERPERAPFSPRAIAWDLLRGPLFGLY